MALDIEDKRLTLLKSAAQYLSPEDCLVIDRALHFAQEAHLYQKRCSGELFVFHPLAVAQYLADQGMDRPTLVAALLHDTLEDTAVSKATIEKNFGHVVADLVDGVSKLSTLPSYSKEMLLAESVQKMIMAMAKDIRVVIIKLADRRHNVQTLNALPRDKQRFKAKETLEIYVPLAARLGMKAMKEELERLSFQAMYPWRSHILTHVVQGMSHAREGIAEDIKTTFERALLQHGVTQFSLCSEKKDPYQVYLKMKHKAATLPEIMDMCAFSVVVASPEECYLALGALHACFKPLPETFKDLIAVPKSNGYQALHTILAGPHGLPLALYIRTQAMEATAQQGILAYWHASSVISNDSKKEAAQKQTDDWVSDLLQIRESVSNAKEFVAQLKRDLKPEEIYVFTPKGAIFSLPQGSTVVDFAYSIHTDIGHHCVGAQVNRKHAPLSTPLSNGDTVHVLTDEQASPDPDWLRFVRTTRARSFIQNALKKQKKEQALKLGERLLRDLLVPYGIDSQDVAFKKRMSEHFHHHDHDAFLIRLGLGDLLISDVLRSLLYEEQHTQIFRLLGNEGPVVQYAPCCHPIPDDSIVGHMTGKGLVVHRTSCLVFKAQARQSDRPSNMLQVTWPELDSNKYVASMRMEVRQINRSVPWVLSLFADEEASLKRLHLEEKDRHHVGIQLNLLVRDRRHLAKIIRRLRHSSHVIKITRI